MAVKHIKEYYNEVCNQYSEMLSEIRDFEKEASQGLIEPERLDQIKESIKPLMNNYQTLSYIMFLLNKPSRKEKEKRYERQNKKLLSKIEKQFTKDGILKENTDNNVRINWLTTKRAMLKFMKATFVKRDVFKDK